MNKSVGLIIIATFSLFSYAESLQCYSCTDCPRVTNSQLITCTAAPTTTTVLPTASTTTTPAANTTLPSNTTLPTNTTTTTTTPSTTTLTTTTVNSTTTINGTEATNTTTASTTTLTTTSPTTTTQALNITNVTSELLRHKRNVLQEHKHIYSYERNDMDRSTSSFYCFRYTMQNANNTNIVVRGCGNHGGTNLTVCDGNVTNIQQCRTCTTDRCNDAHYTKSSVILLLSLFSIVSLRVL